MTGAAPVAVARTARVTAAYAVSPKPPAAHPTRSASRAAAHSGATRPRPASLAAASGSAESRLKYPSALRSWIVRCLDGATEEGGALRARQCVMKRIAQAGPDGLWQVDWDAEPPVWHYSNSAQGDDATIVAQAPLSSPHPDGTGSVVGRRVGAKHRPAQESPRQVPQPASRSFSEPEIAPEREGVSEDGGQPPSCADVVHREAPQVELPAHRPPPPPPPLFESSAARRMAKEVLEARITALSQDSKAGTSAVPTEAPQARKATSPLAAPTTATTAAAAAQANATAAAATATATPAAAATATATTAVSRLCRQPSQSTSSKRSSSQGYLTRGRSSADAPTRQHREAKARSETAPPTEDPSAGEAGNDEAQAATDDATAAGGAGAHVSKRVAASLQLQVQREMLERPVRQRRTADAARPISSGPSADPLLRRRCHAVAGSSVTPTSSRKQSPDCLPASTEDRRGQARLPSPAAASELALHGAPPPGSLASASGLARAASVEDARCRLARLGLTGVPDASARSEVPLRPRSARRPVSRRRAASGAEERRMWHALSAEGGGEFKREVRGASLPRHHPPSCPNISLAA